ncbi:MAG TPA: hypothetical protein VHR17_05515 [Thermoanaerobaculia bacterium]|nr:hypothetical protein [Thermoanaerobaculia bacterium]
MRRASLLDDFVPRWQFAEHHETRIHAPPERVDRAIRSVTAADIRFFRLLTWLRSPRLPGSGTPETILSAPVGRPILEVALGSGFWMLADEPGELVIGTLVIVPPELERLPIDELERRRNQFTASRFAALDEPGYAKAAMSFRWTDEGAGWCRLVTETRVFATDTSARRRFAAYWRVIYPGSATIRRMWLRAIRQRAEA